MEIDRHSLKSTPLYRSETIMTFNAVHLPFDYHYNAITSGWPIAILQSIYIYFMELSLYAHKNWKKNLNYYLRKFKSSSDKKSMCMSILFILLFFTRFLNIRYFETAIYTSFNYMAFLIGWNNNFGPKCRVSFETEICSSNILQIDPEKNLLLLQELIEFD